MNNWEVLISFSPFFRWEDVEMLATGIALALSLPDVTSGLPEESQHLGASL